MWAAVWCHLAGTRPLTTGNELHLTLKGQDVRLRYPPGISSVTTEQLRCQAARRGLRSPGT